MEMLSYHPNFEKPFWFLFLNNLILQIPDNYYYKDCFELSKPG